MSLSDEDKRDIEEFLRDRELKKELWWLQKIPFIAGGFVVGIIFSMCSHVGK